MLLIPKKTTHTKKKRKFEILNDLGKMEKKLFQTPKMQPRQTPEIKTSGFL